ncbi:uncharacterized protein LOC135928486 isoform X2 [Gordionus sp. m RMFG-2023]|uniref:uncharacterized protein LOC135928486 isoform X2 n=1 Tax=Gordionus sp. m RMFG-2023 TaxID=3053472 RepID=UPI0031FC41DB
MRFFDDSKYFGFDDGTYRYPMCPMYPDWDKDLETYRHDFSKDTRSIQTYFLSCGVAALAGWYAPKRYYYNKNKRRMMILWYMRNHRDQWPPERPRKTYGEVITPWFPIRNL